MTYILQTFLTCRQLDLCKQKTSMSQLQWAFLTPLLYAKNYELNFDDALLNLTNLDSRVEHEHLNMVLIIKVYPSLVIRESEPILATSATVEASTVCESYIRMHMGTGGKILPNC